MHKTHHFDMRNTKIFWEGAHPPPKTPPLGARLPVPLSGGLDTRPCKIPDPRLGIASSRRGSLLVNIVQVKCRCDQCSLQDEHKISLTELARRLQTNFETVCSSNSVHCFPEITSVYPMASPRGGLGWTCPPHFCQRSFLRLMQIW